MDDKFIGECVAKARSEFRRSLIVTWNMVLFTLGVTLDWIFNDIVWHEFPRWLFSVQGYAVFVLGMLSATRLLSSGTFNRFVDALARRHPESFYVIVQRERAAFDQRVKHALQSRG